MNDHQSELCVIILQGDSPNASANTILGQFDLSGIPAGRARSPQIEISFTLDADRVLSASARDLDSQRQYTWLSNGRMVARTLSRDATPVMLPDSPHSDSDRYDPRMPGTNEPLSPYPPAHHGIAA